jgi:ABC-type bacteriocin/lantibiotic exporter with double-glycine peptidase domain
MPRLKKRSSPIFFGKHGLLKRLGTTVILVTNAVHRLPYADHIIALDGTGHITEQGKLDQLKDSGGYVQSLAVRDKFKPDSITKGDSTDGPSIEPGKRAAEKRASQAKAEEEDPNRPIGEWSTYKYYFSSIGRSRCLLSLLYLVLSGTAAKLTEMLVTYWTSAISEQGEEVNRLYLEMYWMLAGIGTIFYSFATYHYFLYVVPGSAEELHARLLHSVMNAPLYFFSRTDTGITTNRSAARATKLPSQIFAHIDNRFSQDMSVVDKELPFALIDLIMSLVQTLMGGILMCLVTRYFALTLPPVLLVVWGKNFSGNRSVKGS